MRSALKPYLQDGGRAPFPSRVGARGLWEPAACGNPQPVGTRSLWELAACGSPRPVGARGLRKKPTRNTHSARGERYPRVRPRLASTPHIGLRRGPDARCIMGRRRSQQVTGGGLLLGSGEAALTGAQPAPHPRAPRFLSETS